MYSLKFCGIKFLQKVDVAENFLLFHICKFLADIIFEIYKKIWTVNIIIISCWYIAVLLSLIGNVDDATARQTWWFCHCY